jgi:hypothetical protein
VFANKSDERDCAGQSRWHVKKGAMTVGKAVRSYREFAGWPNWAVNVFAARNLLRLQEWYVRASGDELGSRMFRQAIDMLGGSEAGASALSKRANSLADKHDLPLWRVPMFALADVCGASGIERARRSQHTLSHFDVFWLDKKVVQRDEQLWFRAEHADADRLAQAGKSPIAIAEMGPLWPAGEPAWLSISWPDKTAQQRHEDGVLGVDAPTYSPRGAKLSGPSPELAEGLRDLFAPSELLLKYSATRETEMPKGKFEGTLIGAVSRKRKARVSLELSAEHRFRSPPSSKLFEEFQDRAGASRRLAPLLEFYKLHDGGLLFRPEGARAGISHVDMPGLRDQSAILEVLQYQFCGGGLENAKGAQRFEALLDRLHCDCKSLHVLAVVGVSVLVAPLLGEHQGRVFRIAPLACLLKPWANDMVSAFRKLAESLPEVCRRAPLLIHLEGDPPDVYAEMRLTRLRSVPA